MNEYKFKATIEGVVVGESYQDAIENIGIPSLISSIDKLKIKNIDIKRSDIQYNTNNICDRSV